MLITIYTSPRTAAIHGLSAHGTRSVEVDASALAQPEREMLARLLTEDARLRAFSERGSGPTRRLEFYSTALADVVDPTEYIRQAAAIEAEIAAEKAARKSAVADFLSRLTPDAIEPVRDGGHTLSGYGISGGRLRGLCPAWSDGDSLPKDHPVALEIERRNREAQERAYDHALHVLPAADLVGVDTAGRPRIHDRIAVKIGDLTRTVEIRGSLLARAEAERDRIIAAREAADAAREAERAEWIETHGSARLKRAHAEGFECAAILRDEFIGERYPGWIRYMDTPFEKDSTKPRNPSESALDLLERARTQAPNATLWFWSDAELGRAGYCAEADIELPGGDTERIALLDDACSWELTED